MTHNPSSTLASYKSTPYLKSVFAILWKDLQAEARARELVNSMMLFAVMSVLIFSFALELDTRARQSTVGGILWMTIAYSGIQGLGRSISAEKDKGSLDALLLAPIERSALFFGKMLGNLLFTTIVGLVLLFLLTILFDSNLFIGWLVLVLILGCLGFATTGTLVASIAVHARAREMLLPILMLPVILPIILSASRATIHLIAGAEMKEWMPWLQLLVVIDLIFIAAGYLLFDFIVEE
jgi:heme exporter protein B